jgi:hypothetical protein
MKTKTILSLALALALSGNSFAKRFESEVAFERDGADLIPSTLVAAKAAAMPGAQLETQPVRFSWVLPADQTLAAPTPFVRESTEYWTRVPAAELAKGTTLHTTANGALIRLSPVSGDAKAVRAVSADDVEIRVAGKTLAGRAAMANAAEDAELKMAGTEFPDGTLAFQLKDDVGHGAITLALGKAAGDYLVHVYEPNSREMLSLTMDRITASHGQSYKVFASYNGGEALDAIDGMVSAPNGAQVELAFKRAADGRYVAEVAHDALIGSGPGLWEVHAFASAKGASVQRDAKTAFASSVPRARLVDSAKAALDDDGALSMRFNLDVAAESRFEVRGTLYGFDGGKLRPAAQASTAAILKPGRGQLELSFDAETMAKAGVRGPFQIRDLTLVDQSDLSTVELRRAGVWVIVDR